MKTIYKYVNADKQWIYSGTEDQCLLWMKKAKQTFNAIEKVMNPELSACGTILSLNYTDGDRKTEYKIEQNDNTCN